MSATSSKPKYLVSFFVQFPDAAFPSDEFVEADRVTVQFVQRFKAYAAAKWQQQRQRAESAPGIVVPLPSVVVLGVTALEEESSIIIPR